VAQSVERPTLDFGSDHDLRVLESSPASGSALSVESACPSPSTPPPARTLSLSNKYIFKKYLKYSLDFTFKK